MAATLVLRTVKGSPLTNIEVDNNFSNLNTFGDVVSSNIGILSNLTTSANGNIVIAVNSLVTRDTLINSNIGILTNLTTTANSNIVFAVNELKGNIGVLSSLTTSNIGNLVAAVNELNSNSGVTAATYGSSTNIPVIVINSNGRISSASNVAITTGTTITDDIVSNATYYLTMTTAIAGSINTANVSTTKLFFNPSTGLLTSTDYNSSSDITLKTDIKDLVGALDTIKQLSGKSFTWIDGGAQGYGLIAQEVEKIIPNIVVTNDGIKGINYINIIAFLIESIKELSSQVDQLKKQ
jgi:hypothetical protein